MSLVNNLYFLWKRSTVEYSGSTFICALFFSKCHYYFSTGRYEFLWNKNTHTQIVRFVLPKNGEDEIIWSQNEVNGANDGRNEYVCKRWNCFIQNSSIWIKAEAETEYNTISAPKQCYVFFIFFCFSFFSVALLFTRIRAKIKYAHIMTSTPFENDHFECELVIQLMESFALDDHIGHFYIFVCKNSVVNTPHTHCWQIHARRYSSSLKYWNEFNV